MYSRMMSDTSFLTSQLPTSCAAVPPVLEIDFLLRLWVALLSLYPLLLMWYIACGGSRCTVSGR
jgi:hypothetical protein